MADPSAPPFDLTISETEEACTLDFEGDVAKPQKVLRATIRYRTPTLVLSGEGISTTPDLNGLRDLLDGLVLDLENQYLSQREQQPKAVNCLGFGICVNRRCFFYHFLIRF